MRTSDSYRRDYLWTELEENWQNPRRQRVTFFLVDLSISSSISSIFLGVLKWADNLLPFSQAEARKETSCALNILC